MEWIELIPVSDSSLFDVWKWQWRELENGTNSILVFFENWSSRWSLFNNNGDELFLDKYSLDLNVDELGSTIAVGRFKTI